MFKTLKPFLKGYGKYTLAAVFCVAIEGFLDIFMPFLMSKIVDIGIPNKDLNYVLKMGGLMILMALLALIFGACASRLAAIAGMGFGGALRKGVFDKIQTFSFGNIDKFSTASLVTRCTTDINNIQNTYQMLTKTAIRSPIILICAIIIATNINSSLVIVYLCIVPVLGIALFLIIKLSFPKFQAMLKRYDELNSATQENLVSIRNVKAFVRAEFEKEKFAKANNGLMNASLKAEKIVILNSPIMQLCTYGCIIAILWLGGHMVINGTMLTGELMSFITYVTQILMSLMMLSNLFINILISGASLDRVREVLDEKIDIVDGTTKHDIVDNGSIDFNKVSFSYKKDQPELVLSNIDLHIKSGETIGIIGGTGAAKTSLVQLIPRLYDVVEGSLLVGGKDVRDYSLEVLRDNVAMVLQKNVLFSGTIKENLKWGNANASQEELVEACIQACVNDFIMDLPRGYDTDLGQGGVNVSGGQKQRICIARALIKKPKIIILDDSTSAVDSATDASIRKAFNDHLSNITTIIIAQRISSVKDADRIIVLEDGQINAIGSHDELLSHNEIYQEVFNSQSKGVIEE